MPRFLPIALLVVLLAVPSFAAEPTVTISSVSPNMGPAEGGTAVTITGTGFTTCPICSPPLPPAVFFGDTPAASVSLQNETTLVAVTPPHSPGVLDVTVEQWDQTSEATLRGGFTFVVEGTPSVNERVLLPIFLPPVSGAYGSEFRTSFIGKNSGSSIATVFGLEGYCAILCPPPPADTPYLIAPGGVFDASDVVPNGTPGRFLFVNKEQLDDLSFNLRVYDTSRSADNFGTELPVVRESRFARDRIVLRGIPADPRYRNMLRIYSADPLPLYVTVNGVTQLVTLSHGATVYDPSFAQILLPSASSAYDAVVRRVECGGPAPCSASTAGFWAIVSVTNNDTQMITTITPQP